MVEQLTAALAAQQQQQQQLGSSNTLADTLLALLFVCCGNVGNLLRLAGAGGMMLLNAGERPTADAAVALSLCMCMHWFSICVALFVCAALSSLA
jgi:hypothetical protein